MGDDQSNSGERKMENWSDHDFLSDLPLHIIHSILALVPIEDAVRTCILSKQWRYIWASLPYLVFGNNKYDLTENFVTNVIFLHQGPILNFEFRPSIFLNRFPNTDRWLLFLSRNEIRKLCIIHPDYDVFRVHSSLYSCQKLTHLELSYCELPTLPHNFKGFPCLISLILRSVMLPSNTAVQSLVTHSPLLKTFIYDYKGSSDLRISAPNLRYIQAKGDFKEIAVYAPHMAGVSVSLSKGVFAAEQLLQNSSACHYTKFLGGFPNLQYLVGNSFFIKYLSIGFDSYDLSLAFHQLKAIRLLEVNFHDIKEISVIVRLIMDAPNLQDLHLWFSADASQAPISNFSDFDRAPNFTFNKLRVIKMNEIRGLPSEMELIKLLLSHSAVLETMTLSYLRRLLPERISSLMLELLRYRRASPNAKILLNEGERFPRYG